MHNGGYETYVISDVNSKDKFSVGLYDCTGLIIVGEDKKTNKNISLLSHQDPKEFLTPRLIDSFKLHLIERIKKISEKSKKGSIDAIIFGGNTRSKENFKKSIELVSKLVLDQLKFEPTVATGPKERYGATNMYFDNKNRRAYLFMPQQEKNITYHDFQPKDISGQLQKLEE